MVGRRIHAKSVSWVWLIIRMCLVPAICPAAHTHRDHFSQLASGIRKRKLVECQQSDDGIVSSGHEDESDDSRDPDFLPGKRKRI